MAYPFPIDDGFLARSFGFNDELRSLRCRWLEQRPRPRLVGYLIIKNEEQHISRCLDSLTRFCDSIAVIDNGSTDATLDICREYRVVERIEEHPEEFHEGRFRNRALAICRELGADWILGMDADEVFDDAIVEEIPLLLAPVDSSIDAYGFDLLHFWRGETHYRIDGKFEPFIRIRLFRNRPEFVCSDRQRHVDVNPANLHWQRVRNAGACIRHYGYSDYETTLRKQQTYVRSDPDWDFEWLVDESSAELVEYRPGTRSSEITSEPSKRFLRECRKAGRWLRRCGEKDAKAVFEEFLVSCTHDRVRSALSWGYRIGAIA